MALEDGIKTYLDSDSALIAILTGGIYTSGTVGVNGITRESASGAWDSSGNLKPVSLIKQRDLIIDNQVVDFEDQESSALQVVEIWLYQERLYNSIDSALYRLYQLLQGYIFPGGFEAELVLEINRERDEGALAGASLARQDWSFARIIS